MKKKVGRFGDFGGQYVPETVMNAVHELEQAYDFYKNDPQFQKELTDLYHNYAGRPSMLYYAEKMTKDLGGAKIYIKREDLNHTGSHKINNVLGLSLIHIWSYTSCLCISKCIKLLSGKLSNPSNFHCGKRFGTNFSKSIIIL